MKKIIGALIFMVLIAGLFMPFAMAEPSDPVLSAAPAFVDVHITPEHPLGADWSTGLGGDIITVHAEVEDADEVYIRYGFCNRETCNDADFEIMTRVDTSNFWTFQLPGDTSEFAVADDVYEASHSTNVHVYYQIRAWNTTDWSNTYYPNNLEVHEFYPSWPPQQINATSDASSIEMFVGDTFTVSGISNYWNSTAQPRVELINTTTIPPHYDEIEPVDYSQLYPADISDVEVKVGGTSFFGKTDSNGDYTIQVTAPATPGSYQVNTTVSNSTANRNVPCKADEITITVKEHKINATLELNTTTTLPEQQLWANGTVEIDGAPAPAGLDVTVYIPETGEYFNVTTDASGNYTSQFNATNVTGTFTVNITAYCPTYDITAWNETEFTIVAVPLPDLVVTNTDIVISGDLVESNTLFFNFTIANSGIADALDSEINITMDGALLNSSRHDILEGEEITIMLDWAATLGSHNLTVEADPANETEESSESNNLALKAFEILADFDGDGIPDINDPDDDGDRTNDTEDAFPLDPDETTDTDGDNIGDNADTDDDGDGVPDSEDDLPLNANETVDSDGDGIGDNADTDDDNDGTLDSQDAFPLDPTESADYDGDGIGDNADTDDDSDGLDDATDDPYPMDTDNDGLANNMDQDDDGDGIPDPTDTMPLDTDNDGINNGEDADIDGDGVDNAEDAFPLDPDETIDTDGDGIGNNADNDDDGDGVPDEEDAAPLDPEISEPEAEEYSPSTGIIIAIFAIGAVLVAIVMLYPGFKT